MSRDRTPQSLSSESDLQDALTAMNVRADDSSSPFDNLQKELNAISQLPAEVPEAIRETSPSISGSTRSWSVKIAGVAVVTMGLGLLGFGALLILQQVPTAQLRSESAASSASNPSTDNNVNPNRDGADAVPSQGQGQGRDTQGAENVANDLLGHFPYEEAPQSDLKPVTADGRIRLRSAAAEAYLSMDGAARQQGIVLSALSGFRAVSEQERIFFEVKAQRNQEAAKRAEVSAPPGYSEHHTGYAIDMGDARTPATNLSPDFERTAAFQWLDANAARYNFELSFPRNNPQGVSYEPWHWRFVGDRHSLETFYKSRDLSESPAPQPSPPSASDEGASLENR